MTLVQKREEAESSVQICAKSDIEQFVDTVKTQGFSWPIHSSLGSSAKLDIVKVDKTQMVEISWETSDYLI